MERMTITLPDGLKGRAHGAGLNVSGTTARAIERALRAIKETETGATAAKQVSPATTTAVNGGAS